MGRTDEVRLSLAGESGQCEGQEGKMGDRVEQSGPRAVTRHLVTEAGENSADQRMAAGLCCGVRLLMLHSDPLKHGLELD